MMSRSSIKIKLTRRANRILADWKALEKRAKAIHAQLGVQQKVAFYEMLLVQILLQTNLNELYIAGECFETGKPGWADHQLLSPICTQPKAGPEPMSRRKRLKMPSSEIST
jgi:hypothetical protein